MIERRGGSKIWGIMLRLEQSMVKEFEISSGVSHNLDASDAPKSKLSRHKSLYVSQAHSASLSELYLRLP